MRRICRAVRTLHTLFPDVEFLWPLHPNPAIRSTVEPILGYLPRVRLTDPLAYGSFVAAMKRSTLILTDSGGIQEEAPALGKPVLVLRNESERPEAIEAGVARLVGHDPRKIVAEACRLLCDPIAYRSMARGASPYGDGQVRRADRARPLAEFLGVGGEQASGSEAAGCSRRDSHGRILPHFASILGNSGAGLPPVSGAVTRSSRLFRGVAASL